MLFSPASPPGPVPSTCLSFDSRCRAAVALVWEGRLVAGGAGCVVVFLCVSMRAEESGVFQFMLCGLLC